MMTELAMIPPPLRWEIMLHQDLVEAAPLKRGGSCFICCLDVKTETVKLDKRGRKTRYKTTVSSPCKYRCKLAHPAKILRHMRRVHGRR